MAFHYFPERPMYSQGVMLALNMGGDINDIELACRDFAEGRAELGGATWYEAWSALAQRVATQARSDENAGRMLTASHKHRRACIYYIVAERFLDSTDERKQVAYKGVLDEFAAFVARSGEPVESVEIPYGEAALPGLFIPAGKSESASAVININGFDTFKELLYLRLSGQARPRGMSMLIVDLPGAGEALRLRGMPTRFDTEVPIAACVDYLESRDDVSSDRIGLMGNSLAGYYAPRAASFEKRLKCCAAWGAVFDWGALTRRKAGRRDAVRSVPDSQYLWVTGAPTMEAALEIADKCTLDGVIEKLTVPLLILHGEDDRLVPWSEAERTAAAAINSPRVDLVRGTAELGGAGHVSADSFESGSDLVFDWVAEVLHSESSASDERARR